MFHTPSSSIDLLCLQDEYFVFLIILTWRHQLAFVAPNLSANSIKNRIWQYTNMTAFKNSCAVAGVEVGRRL